MEWLVDGILKRKRRYALWGDAREQVARSLVAALQKGVWCGRAVHGKRVLCVGLAIAGVKEASGPRLPHVLRVLRHLDLVVDLRNETDQVPVLGDPCVLVGDGGDGTVQCRIEGDELVMVQTQHSAPDQPYWGELRISCAEGD